MKPLKGLRFRRLLVPVDFSAGAARAVEAAVRLAETSGADLSTLHVAGPEVSEGGMDALSQAVREFSRRSGAMSAGIQVIVGQGDPAAEIVVTARRIHADLVVLPTRSRPHRVASVIGSTARGVLRLCRLPVLTLDTRAPMLPPRHVTWLCFDSAAGRRAFDLVRSLALTCRPDLLLVAPDQPAGADDLEESGRYLQAFAGIELRVETQVLPAATFWSRLAELETDLLVVGRNDAGQRIPHLLSDGVRHLVRRAPFPVLSVPSSRIDEIDTAFHAVSRTFTQSELSRSSHETAEADQVMAELTGTSPHLLLGTYGDLGLLDAVDRLGLLSLLRQKGLDRFVVRIGQRGGRDRVQLYHGGVATPETLLVEVVEHISSIEPPAWMAKLVGSDPLRVLELEWVLLQNPQQQFSADRPPLPGQKSPGLGIGYEVAELFVLAAERLGCDGLWNTPQHYHNARLY
ncbi:MAG TPA: universal stress protein, partial [Candidatus Xenobia bacterium]